MTIPVKVDQVTLGINRLLEQFKNKPSIEGMLRSYLLSVNDLEDLYFQLLDERSVYTAVGVQLDLVGALVNEPRKGKSDDDYRLAILLRIGLNNSEGTPNDTLSILANASQATSVKIWEHFPASSVYYINKPEKTVLPAGEDLIVNGQTVVGNACAEITIADRGQDLVGQTYVNAVQTASPASTGSQVVIFDPYEDTLILSELQPVTATLIDNDNNVVIDNEGNAIKVITDYITVENNLTDRAVLAELPQP